MPTSIYKLKSGKRVPSVTTIGKRFQDSEGLKAWNYNTGYAHAEAGLGPDRFRVQEEAADIGTYVHALFAWHLDGEEGPEPDPAQSIGVKYLTFENIERGRVGYQKALDWLAQNSLEITSLEIPLVSEQHRFGGTPDGLTFSHEKLGLADWKTSNKLYSDYLIQLAGYWILWEENNPDQPITGGIDIVRFSKDYGDFTHFHADDLTLEKEQFLMYRRAYENDLKIRKRI